MTKRHAAKTKLRAAIYCRISADREGRELGVQRQEEDSRALAAKLDATVVEVYIDNDISASTKSSKPRPEYQRMLRDARDGQFDVILAYTSGRLTRRPREFEDQIDLAVDHGIRYEYVRSPSFGLDTAQGRRIARTMAAQDIGEAEDISERAQRTKQQAAANGGYRGGRRPFGFEPDGMTVRDAEAAEIRAAADDLLAGMSINGVCRGLNERGVTTSTGKPWKGRTLTRMLVRPRNAALIDHYGEIMGPAQWPAVLDEGTWRAVVAMLEDPARALGPRKRWLLSGIATCGRCGATVEAGSSPKRGGRDNTRRPVYHCSRKREIARDAVQLDDFIVSLVIDRLSQKDAGKLLHTPGETVDVKALHAEAYDLRRRKDEITDLWSRKVIDTRQLERGTTQINEELETVEAKLAAVSRKSVFAGVVGGNVEESWDALPFERKRAVVAALLTIELHPARRGRAPGWREGEHYFDPDSIKLSWLR